MIAYRDLVTTLRRLPIEPTQPVIVHTSLSAFGYVPGGADVFLGALLTTFDCLITPTFTYQTMIIPEDGPPDNAIRYGSGKHRNKMATFFRPDLPADRLMGTVAEKIRKHPKASRSFHPILSFAGISAGAILSSQTLEDPLAVFSPMISKGGWVLLLGVNHTCNTAIHYAERLAGRRGFTRWALTPRGIVECPNFPGCSLGFEAIRPYVSAYSHTHTLGDGVLEALPLQSLVDTAQELIAADSQALLCENPDCERCQTLRATNPGTQVL